MRNGCVMRNGSGQRRPLCVESLEERNAPGVFLPTSAEVPVLPPAESPQGGGVQGGGSKHESLTLAIVTEEYPLPPELDRPGVVTPRPYSGDPIAIYTIVSYQTQ